MDRQEQSFREQMIYGGQQTMAMAGRLGERIIAITRSTLGRAGSVAADVLPEPATERLEHARQQALDSPLVQNLRGFVTSRFVTLDERHPGPAATTAAPRSTTSAGSRASQSRRTSR